MSGTQFQGAPTGGEVSVPADLIEALAANEPARVLFEGLAASHQREYVRWIEEAKRPETRARRVAGTLEMLTAGGKQGQPRP
jgi:uncharacterized protein YdeI (YjbR/CyaY-like superfamily)